MTGIALAVLFEDTMEQLVGNTLLMSVLVGMSLMGLGVSFRFGRYGPDDTPTMGTYFVFRFVGWAMMGMGLLALVEGVR